MNKIRSALAALCVIALALFASGAYAAAVSEGVANMTKEKAHINQALAAAKNDLTQAKSFYDAFHDNWLDVEDSVKADSKLAYKDIETQMGQVEYAFIVNKQDDVAAALQSLQQILDRYIQGQYAADGSDLPESTVTLPAFISLLQDTQASVKSQDHAKALAGIAKIRDSWLSVEGHVVAQSASVYNDSERDMVVVNAMIADNNYDGARKTLDAMIAYLSPLAEKSAYTFWDAAMIPIREGLEALLVVGALLAFVKKSESRQGTRWIWLGVSGGLLVSAILAVIVKLVFSSGAFGKNNFLIAGFTGVFAAAMLLYMSYWLHSNSNIKQWNRYLKDKTQAAVSTGKLVSLGALSFLAVFREGTETVLFIIGMVNQISMEQLLLGIAIGLGILVLVAYLMLFLGVRMPIRPFFLVSSLIVFYLCVKFMGLGVHSLQLAGMLPVSSSPSLPSIDFLGFFPSWQSAAPQFAIVLAAVGFLLYQRIVKRTKSDSTLSK